ncbi:MAG: HU family DNA-binding protein [Microcystaceae cyanobacterium]
MNKEQLIDQIAQKTPVTKKQANQILDALTSSIIETVAGGEKLTLVGFGTFERRDRKERSGRNPQSGEALNIPATRVPAFSAGKLFKEKVTESLKKTEKSPKAKVKKKK